MLVKMIDGGIENITSDKDYVSGCETCDYGSCYTNYFDIILTESRIHIETSQIYEYCLSEGFMMKLIIENIDDIKRMKEAEFGLWLEEKCKEYVGGKLEYSIS